MKLIFCVDKKNGIMFNGRRQSQDKLLRSKMLEYVADSVLWMSSYSAKQFVEGGSFKIDDDYMTKAAEGDYCFVENGEYDVLKCDEIVLFKWNRDYPADKTLNVDFKSLGFKKKSTEDFAGLSHKKITMEIYCK